MNGEIDNIYHIDGKIPVGKAIPFGLQHILAMFVANIAALSLSTGIGFTQVPEIFNIFPQIIQTVMEAAPQATDGDK
ncbi:MAG: hypothetical protein K2M70_08060 [Lachnospiraceae bacterium]|nr:hypothetical protein [Lachnospiraceae bacterium]